MPASEYTWEDVRQAPEDGKRREAIGGERYVTGPATVRHQRVRTRLLVELDRLPVRVGGERVGEIDLEEVFSRGS